MNVCKGMVVVGIRIEVLSMEVVSTGAGFFSGDGGSEGVMIVVGGTWVGMRTSSVVEDEVMIGGDQECERSVVEEKRGRMGGSSCFSCPHATARGKRTRG